MLILGEGSIPAMVKLNDGCWCSGFTRASHLRSYVPLHSLYCFKNLYQSGIIVTSIVYG